MTSLSLVPEIAKYKGISFENLVEKILLMQVSIDEKKNNSWHIFINNTNNNYIKK